MEALRKYLNSLTVEDQRAYAGRSGTTLGYLRKAISAGQMLGESLTISLERESGGKVLVEQIRPDVDWAYLRTRRKKAAKSAA